MENNFTDIMDSNLAGIHGEPSSDKMYVHAPSTKGNASEQDWASALRRKKFRGHVLQGRNRVRSGVYLVAKKKRGSNTLLRKTICIHAFKNYCSSKCWSVEAALIFRAIVRVPLGFYMEHLHLK